MNTYIFTAFIYLVATVLAFIVLAGCGQQEAFNYICVAPLHYNNGNCVL